jgi:hypothetical protein
VDLLSIRAYTAFPLSTIRGELHVKIQNSGVRKEASGNAHISDFQITVNYRRTEFTSTSKDLPCSADGIPTEEGNRRIKEAVEEIKARIRATR